MEGGVEERGRAGQVERRGSGGGGEQKRSEVKREVRGRGEGEKNPSGGDRQRVRTLKGR